MKLETCEARDNFPILVAQELRFDLAQFDTLTPDLDLPGNHGRWEQSGNVLGKPWKTPWKIHMPGLFPRSVVSLHFGFLGIWL